MNPTVEWHLETHHLGKRVLVYEVIDSTSTHCMSLAGEEKNHGLAVVAHAQTAGRGQHGRRWLCQPGTGVLLSVLLFPPPQLRRPAILTAWAAVSVCELIQDTVGLHATIKWPNDVLIQGRKVCGILIEQQHGVVLGLGLNLNQSRESFLAEGLTEAGSLRLFTGKEYDVEEMARQMIGQLDGQYGRLLSGDLSLLETCWRERLGLIDKHVFVEGYTTSFEGRLLDVTFEALVLDTGAEPLFFPPEAIRHIRAR